MGITALELLDTSIAQLQTLVAFLNEQLDQTEVITVETCACEDIARSLGRLIRTHQAERLAGSPYPTENADAACRAQPRERPVS